MRELKAAFLLAVVTSSAVAGPYYRPISFNLVNTQNNSSRRVCIQRILGACVQWREETNLRTRHWWTETQKATAQRALSIVADRMLDPNIMNCALNNARKAHNEGSPFRLDNYDNVRALMWGQMTALLTHGFPVVTVQINELGDYGGLAQVGNFVDARAITGSTFSVSGRFHFEMDIGTMDTAGDLQVAGVMAHEMLHQMTHSHPNGYDDENLVVVFQNCFVNNGTYARPGLGFRSSGLVQPLRACSAGAQH